MKVSRIGFILGFIGLAGAAPSFANSLSICDQVAGNLIENCSFDSDSFLDWNTTPAAEGSAFNVTSNLPLDSGMYDARFGATDSEFDYIDQSFSTTPGQTYTVTFYVDTTVNGLNNGEFVADWNGNQILLITNKGGETDSVPYVTTVTNGSAVYEEYTFTETATSSTTDLKFGGYAGTSYYHLDDISVVDPPAPAPEPSSISFGLAGLLGIGLAARSYLQKPANS